jgi:hypothetical protein
MKKSFLLRLAILLGVCLSASITLPAQFSESENEYAHYSNEKILNLGSNGIAVIGSDPFAKLATDAVVLRFDSTAKLVWKKSYKQPYGTGRFDLFANSADGNDIYILSFETIEKKINGGSDPALTWIDAKTGESKTKEFPAEAFGYVYTMYANSKYLFVYTTSYPLYRREIEKNPTSTKLYRFEKATMEMVLLEDEMKDASPYTRVFWQVFRVENDFVEAYIIKEAAQHIVVGLARFNNDGKKIKSADIAFDLKETFPRQGNSYMPLNAGISNGMSYEERYSKPAPHDAVFIDPDLELIFPLSACQLHFDPLSKNYYAYGICGYDEKQGAGTYSSDYTGFYIARIDENYKLAEFKEHANVPLLEKDLRFSKAGPAGERTIDATRTPTDPLALYISGGLEKEYYFSIDPISLLIKKTMTLKMHKYKLEYSFYECNTFTSSLDKELYWVPDITKLDSFVYTKHYVPTARWQYVVLISDENKEIKVYTSRMQ